MMEVEVAEAPRFDAKMMRAVACSRKRTIGSLALSDAPNFVGRNARAAGGLAHTLRYAVGISAATSSPLNLTPLPRQLAGLAQHIDVALGYSQVFADFPPGPEAPLVTCSHVNGLLWAGGSVARRCETHSEIGSG